LALIGLAWWRTNQSINQSINQAIKQSHLPVCGMLEMSIMQTSSLLVSADMYPHVACLSDIQDKRSGKIQLPSRGTHFQQFLYCKNPQLDPWLQPELADSDAERFGAQLCFCRL